MNKPVRTRGAVIYTRVSTGEQDKHGTSPESQRDACRSKALSLNLPIIAEYYDPGISGGFLLMRTEFQAAIADIQAGRADTLICPNISRYSRDVEHQQAIKKAVRAAGGRLLFCDADFEDTASGDLNFTIQGGFAAYERQVIKERTYSGHQRRAGQGIQTARATSPFGYVIPKVADILRGNYPPETLGKYLVIEEQAAVVRDLFEKYDEGGYSLNDLSKMLNRSGLPTPRGGAMWRASNVRFIFTNPTYKGVGVFGRFDHTTDETRLMQKHKRTGLPMTCARSQQPADPETWITWEVPALVTAEQWERVNVRLKENKRLKGGNPQRVRMLSGRVFCPYCGSGMACLSPVRNPSKKKDSSEVFIYPHRYTCLHYRKTLLDMGEAGCQPAGYYVPEVEAAVIQALLEACQRPEAIREALTAYQKAQEPTAPTRDARQEIAALDKALALLTQRQNATVQAQIAGIMAGADPAAYSAVFADLAAERKDLEDRRGRLTQALHSKTREGGGRQPVPGFAQLLDTARKVLQSEDVAGEVKRDILGSVIEKVICLKGEPRKPGHERQPAGAEVVFLPGVFEEENVTEGNFQEDTLQCTNAQPEINRLRAGNRHGSGLVFMGNSESTAP